jgi:hypothetical protein
MKDRNVAPECHGVMEKILTPTFVKVFNAYQTAAFDKEQGKTIRITSQAEHSAFLRRNRYEEVGNDPSRAPLSDEEVAHNHAQQRTQESAYEWQESETEY